MSEPELALIVGAARSGTTLLRLIMDAHPEVGCPAEAGLPSLMSHMAGVWMTVDERPFEEPGQEDPGASARRSDGDGRIGALGDPAAVTRKPGSRELPEDVRDWIRQTLLMPMGHYAVRGSKRLYVDKSLDSAFYLPLVEDVLPGTRSILLFRHVMDTVASGIEASPWGFQAYGYGPYVQASPHNWVAALANYWLVHVTAAAEWAESHPSLCHRVHYEDLVTQPADTVRAIFSFLGVEYVPSVLQSAFARREARYGPGDYKVAHTSSVHSGSVGHGKRVPVDLIPEPLLGAVNDKLRWLGYDPLSSAWNAEERAVDSGRETVWARRLANLMEGANLRDGPRRSSEVGVFAVVAEDQRALRWIVDVDARKIRQGDGDVSAVVTGTTEDLVRMLTAEENLGVLVRSGRIRHLAPDQELVPVDVPAALGRMLELLDTETSDTSRPASEAR